MWSWTLVSHNIMTIVHVCWPERCLCCRRIYKPPLWRAFDSIPEKWFENSLVWNIALCIESINSCKIYNILVHESVYELLAPSPPINSKYSHTYQKSYRWLGISSCKLNQWDLSVSTSVTKSTALSACFVCISSCTSITHTFKYNKLDGIGTQHEQVTLRFSK